MFNLDPLAKAIQSVDETEAMPVGWCYGRGFPSTFIARENAKFAAAILRYHGADSLAVFPDVDGGVMVTGYKGNASFEILALPDGTFDIVFEDGDMTSPSNFISDPEKLSAIVRAQGWQPKYSSASFHRNIMTKKSSATTAWLSRTQAAGEFPLLNGFVLLQPQGKSAPTSGNFTQSSLVDRQQRFGASQQMNYLPAPAWPRAPAARVTSVITTSTTSAMMSVAGC